MFESIANAINRLISAASTPLGGEPLSGLIAIGVLFALIGLPTSRRALDAAQEKRFLIGRWFVENAATAEGNGGDHYIAAKRYSKENATMTLSPIDRMMRVLGIAWIVGVLIWARSEHQTGEQLGDRALAVGAIGIVLAIAATLLTLGLQRRSSQQASLVSTLIPGAILLAIAMVIPIASTVSWVISAAITFAGSLLAGRRSEAKALA